MLLVSIEVLQVERRVRKRQMCEVVFWFAECVVLPVLYRMMYERLFEQISFALS